MVAPDKHQRKEIKDKIAELDGVALSAYLSSKSGFILGPAILGMAFEKIAKPNEDGFSRAVQMELLSSIHPGFRTSNGGDWCRSDQGYLGKKYIIVRHHTGGMISAVKLDGFNDNKVQKYRGIKAEIVDAISKRRCAVLDTTSNIEIDHKNGKYTDWRNLSPETQDIRDFQPLNKTVNIAKREHCNKCKKTGKRYDATALGYKTGFISGNADSDTCVGCYWYDPARFNSVISKDFKKEDEQDAIGW